MQGLTECCKLTSGVWGRAPAGIEFGAYFAVKSDIWWQQF